MRIWVALLVTTILTASTLWSVTAQGGQPVAAGEPVLLRLKYATFDPLRGEPQMEPALRTDAYTGTGEGAYIVQFRGPVDGAWKEQVQALGGRVMDYLPDYAFLVWMDGALQEQVAALDIVRWVGLYQPAYKISPNLDRTRPLYRVVLFKGADLGAVETRLASLNMPTTEVTGEQFTLLLPDGGVEEVAAWPEVLWIENRPLYRVSNNVATGIMGATTAWTNGYTGAGQMVTVADTGIDTGVDNSSMHDDFEGRFVQIESYPVDASWTGCAANVGADDGADDVDSGHGTHVLGSVLGDGTRSSGTIKGTAYQAVPAFQAAEQWTTWTGSCASYPSGYYLTGFPLDLYPFFLDAYNWGSRIHSNSWGSPRDGEYTADSEAVDQFVWDHPDMLIVFAAGNAGTDKKLTLGYVDEDSLDAPGTAKNVLTVGASDNERDSGGYNPGGPCSTWGTCWPSDFPYDPTKTDRISDNRGELAAFSARGPANDGRLKPDVVAPGTNILSTRSSVAASADYYAWGPYNAYYMYMGGTSMATPLTAGAAALVREYYLEEFAHTPSAALLKATIINSAVDILGYGNSSQEAGKPIPNNHEGWGRVNVNAATSGGRYFEEVDWDGAEAPYEYTYSVGSSATPFKVTLVWSDYPGSPTAGGLVNDLDLVVTGPGGTYHGNYFSGGWSVTGGSADRTNNVESVYVQNPTAGTWTVSVDGYNVPEPGTPGQPFAFALVTTGAFGAPPAPVAAFSGSPTSGDAPLEVSFTDLSTGEITSWDWDFGDLGTSTEPNPIHTYTAADDYTVSLTVTGPGGSDTETKTGYIHVTEPVPPVADFSGSPTSGKAPLAVKFTDLSTGSVTSWSWDFGDGDGSAEQNPTHFYADVGYYDVSLTVDGPLGPDTQTVNNYIHVTEPAERVYLPLVMRGYAPPVPADPIVNGDFEDGPWVGWIEYSYQNYPIVVDDVYADPTPPHSGSWLAWLGGAEDEMAYIEQTVTVPAGRSWLHYWQWRAASTLNCDADQASLLVNGLLVTAYDLCYWTVTGGWVETAVDLSAYVGQTVPIQFLVETSLITASSWYIDDVSFEVSAAAGDADGPVAAEPGVATARKVAPESWQP